MEHEIKLLKEREVEQMNKSSGYETLLRDGIPLNEHFLALKNKFNKEQNFLKEQIKQMETELEGEKQINQKLNRNINIKRNEYEDLTRQVANEKEVRALDLRRLEAQLYTEEHSRVILKSERDVVS